MNKKKIIIIGSLVFIVVITIVLIYVKKAKNNIVQNNEKSQIISFDDVDYDETTELYYIKDEKTGEIIGASYDKSALQFYIDNPDYNPTPLIPRSTNLEDFVEKSIDETFDNEISY